MGWGDVDVATPFQIERGQAALIAAGASSCGLPFRSAFCNGVGVSLPVVQVPDYALIRVIGRGSYGEVWLGRSVTGTYRAVKLVHRERFDSARPFEREFAGIQRFEAISNRHPSQLRILHVGRLADDSAFYYVMELADPVAGAAARIVTTNGGFGSVLVLQNRTSATSRPSMPMASRWPRSRD